jgi:hypothetical protein
MSGRSRRLWDRANDRGETRIRRHRVPEPSQVIDQHVAKFQRTRRLGFDRCDVNRANVNRHEAAPNASRRQRDSSPDGIKTSVNAVFDIDALDTPDGFVKRLMGVDI